MKKVVKFFLFVFIVGHVVLANPNNEIFKQLKSEYASGEVKILVMPYGKEIKLKSIFELPEHQQKKAWDKLLSKSWKETGEGMKKESKILAAGIKSLKTGKVPQKHSDYIRSREEIEELLSQKVKNDMRDYEEACNKGNIFLCLQAGGNYYRGIYVKKNYKKARQYFSKACKLKSGKGCGYLGQIYFMGRGVRENHQKAMKIFDKACIFKAYDACIILGDIYAEGYKKILKDKEHAEFYYEKACTKQVNIGCKYLSNMK